jgi:hypothetical protein
MHENRDKDYNYSLSNVGKKKVLHIYLHPYSLIHEHGIIDHL